jgi:hypothetical protein
MESCLPGNGNDSRSKRPISGPRERSLRSLPDRTGRDDAGLETEMILVGNVQSVDRVSEALMRNMLRNEAVGCRRLVRSFFASDASLSRRGTPTADQIAPVG